MSIFRNLLMSMGSSPTPPGPTPRLPEDYQEVEYLQSTGTQYIKTQYKNKANSSYDVKFQITGYNGQWNTVFGSRTDYNTADAFDLGFANSGYFYVNIGTKNPSVKYGITIDYDYISKINKYRSVIDNTTSTYNATALVDSNYYTYIFALNQAGSTLERGKLKLYYFNIYEDDILVREFVPCYRKSDNVAGLYELNEGIFFVNEGTGTFNVGSDIVPGGDIPSIYQKVEYIQSYGNEYINTKYLHKANTKYSLKMVGVEYNEQYNSVFGGRYQWNSTDSFGLGFRDGGYFYCNVGGGNSFYMYNFNANTEYIITMDKQTTYFNGNSTNTNGSNLIDGLYWTYIFALNEAGQIIEKSKIKLYYLKIYEGDVLVKDYVPCYRKTDNVIGLYDKVSKEFLTNAGSGAFTAGPDVE